MIPAVLLNVVWTAACWPAIVAQVAVACGSEPVLQSEMPELVVRFRWLQDCPLAGVSEGMVREL